MPFPPEGLYCLTDPGRAWGRTLVEQARLCLEAGARMIQLRDKLTPRRDLIEQGREMVKWTRRYGGILIVNDDPELALEMGADGAHVGQEDMAPEAARALLGPDKIIGLSTHTPQQVLEAQERPVDYIGFGPVYATGSKETAYAPRGAERVGWAIRHSRAPVVPIGGITAENLGPLIEQGARYAAVISAVVGAQDVHASVQRLMKQIGNR